MQIYTGVQKCPSMVPATDRKRNLENEWLEILMHLPIKRTCIQSDKKVEVWKNIPIFSDISVHRRSPD